MLDTTTPIPERQRLSQDVLFVIDDARVVHALRADLNRGFGEDFRVTSDSSAAAEMATLRELPKEHEPVALLIVDHNMREMPESASSRPVTR